MRQWDEAQLRCLDTIERLNDEQVWKLDRATQIRYALGLRPALEHVSAGPLLRTIVANYHADHATVEALLNSDHPRHQEAWQLWARQVALVLHSTRLHWSHDIAVDADDLAQVALAEVARSLGSYGYRSKLSTWIFRVVVLSARRQGRSQRAAKRAARLASLQQFPQLDVPVAPERQPEAEVRARLLVAQCLAILADHPDKRLAAIFRLWAAEERRVEEIGALYRLHPSRVGALLREIRRLLQAHPDLQGWQAGSDT